jgi:hypothetical protein
MFMFTLAGQGDLLATQVAASGLNFTAYAVGPAEGSTNVGLVNKDETETVHATVDIGKAATSGALTLLRGPSLSSTTGFTINGAPIAPDGTWAPASAPTIPIMGNTLVVDVPPASAAVVRAQ